jgi:membrane protease YdiL (CAAX protease family)
MAAAALLLWRLVPPLPGERPARVRGHRALSIAAGLMLGTLAALANLLSVLAGGDAPRATTGEGLEPGVVALVVHVALLAPVAEELAFRGLIYRQIRGLMTPLPATVLSALLFSIMHANLHQAVWALVLGLVAAFAYEQTKSLITPTLIHGLFNAVPIGVAVVRCRPDDVGPLWLVLCAVALIFTVAARGASRSAAAPP